LGQKGRGDDSLRTTGSDRRLGTREVAGGVRGGSECFERSAKSLRLSSRQGTDREQDIVTRERLTLRRIDDLVGTSIDHPHIEQGPKDGIADARERQHEAGIGSIRVACGAGLRYVDVGGIVEADGAGDDLQLGVGVGHQTAGNLDAHASEAALDRAPALEAEDVRQVPRRDPDGHPAVPSPRQARRGSHVALATRQSCRLGPGITSSVRDQ
jgi:hypothetical protein